MIVNIQRQPGSNIISVVDRVKVLLQQLQSSLPPSVKVQILTDRTETIRASVQDVQFELMLTIGLVVMVIFLFLRNLSATVIPSVAVPLSLVGTFGVMYLLGYSLNNLTLMALTISTGFVVDDAIVMIENIERFMEEGESPLRSGVEGFGADRLHDCVADGFADRCTDSTAVHGRYRGPAVPRIRGHAGGHDSGFRDGFVDPDADDVRQAAASATIPIIKSGFYQSTENFYNRVIEFYGRTLKFVLKHQTTTLLVTVGTLVADAVPLRCRPQGLFPGAGHGSDSGYFRRRRRTLLSPPWRGASRQLAQSDPEGSRRGEPFFLYRN